MTQTDTVVLFLPQEVAGCGQKRTVETDDQNVVCVFMCTVLCEDN